MNFFKNIFKKNPPPKAFHYREIPAESYLVSNCIVGDWNDPSRILAEKSMILEIIPKGENPAIHIKNLNKLYYENLPVYYSLTEEQAARVAPLIHASAEDRSTISAEWPRSLTNEDYEKLNQVLKLEFVSLMPLPEKPSPKYIISINKDFWLRSNNQLFSTAGFNTYERQFLESEFIHADYNTAFQYAIVITNRLWAGRGPDNSYYFEEQLKEELEAVANTSPIAKELTRSFTGFSASEIAFNGYLIYTKPDLPYNELWELYKQEYDRVLNQYKNEFDLLQAVYEVIEHAPFYITKVV